MVRKSDIHLIVILGPTASGKSSWGVEIAHEYNGEIVSADSRQVYEGLDIGSGKVTENEMGGVPHYLLNVIKAGSRFTVADYKELADTAIEAIYTKRKTPLLVGGSALYLDAVIENYQLPNVDQDINYRAMLERRSTDDLCRELERVDPRHFEVVDKNNKRRLIRALEVFHLTGKPFSEFQHKGEDMYRSMIVGIEMPRDVLYARIDARVDSRLEQGMIEEVERLLSLGISHEWLEQLGLEYRYISRYLCNCNGSISEKNEMVQKLKFAIHDFARRQLIWFRSKENIHWCSSIDEIREHINESGAFRALI
ncbi:MAG: tRNA (adenosine(37)-N6)-dimethylallyltransferase MiaA [Patescibacteria group bacterium]